MKRLNIKDINNFKNIKKITCLTAYTTSIAKIIDNHVDMILVGDSLGPVIYGMKNTQKVTLEMMMAHGKAVCLSTKKAFTIIDMPFGTYNNKKDALINSRKLLKFTKCQSIKLETDNKNIDIVKHLIKNKISVVAHIGVNPQKFKNFSKIKVVGKNIKEQESLKKLATQLENAGIKIIVLECIKEKLSEKITNKLKIPTIGIGASIKCDGQVLVINDILDTENNKEMPRFVKKYASLHYNIEKAVKNYTREVVNKKFPKPKNTY